jgi:hypothetical protein
MDYEISAERVFRLKRISALADAPASVKIAVDDILQSHVGCETVTAAFAVRLRHKVEALLAGFELDCPFVITNPESGEICVQFMGPKQVRLLKVLADHCPECIPSWVLEHYGVGL